VLQTCSGASVAMGIFAHRKIPEAMESAGKYMAKDVEEAVMAADDVGLDLSAFGQTVGYWRSL